MYAAMNKTRAIENAISNPETAIPGSLIAQQLIEQQDLISHLDHEVEILIGQLKPVLTHGYGDKSAVRPVRESTSSCELEAQLMARNENLRLVIERMQETRNAIRL